MVGRSVLKRGPGALFRLAGAVLFLLAVSAGARADALDEYIRTRMIWLHIPGLSLAVVKDGKIVRAKGYGLANVETATPATPETVYKIGSVSKQFLAAAIMLLVQDGKLRLDDSIRKYLEDTPDSWKAITVRHLLTHTSGIVREPPGFDPYKVQADPEVIKSAYPEPLRFLPGEKWEYSNTNYYCLAEIIRKVSGKPWADFIAERLFAPSGMATTRTTTSEIVPQRATGYETRGGLQNAENWLALRPSGAFLSTVLDFARWDAALSSDSILSLASRTQMWTPATLTSGAKTSYGFGWFVDSVQGHQRAWHSGGVPGFVCEFDRYPEDHLTVIVMINVGFRDLHDLADRAAAFYVPALARPVPIEPALPDPEPCFIARVKKGLADFTQGKIDSTLFAPQQAASLARDVKSGFTDTLRQLGPIRSLVLVEYRRDGENRVCRFRLEYRNLTLSVGCTFDRENKITRFSIQD